MGCFLPVICLDSLKVAMMKIFQFLFTDTEVPHCIFCTLTAKIINHAPLVALDLPNDAEDIECSVHL